MEYLHTASLQPKVNFLHDYVFVLETEKAWLGQCFARRTACEGHGCGESTGKVGRRPGGQRGRRGRAGVSECWRSSSSCRWGEGFSSSVKKRSSEGRVGARESYTRARPYASYRLNLDTLPSLKCPPNSSWLSLPPHVQMVTGSISEGVNKLFSGGLLGLMKLKLGNSYQNLPDRSTTADFFN